MTTCFRVFPFLLALALPACLEGSPSPAASPAVPTDGTATSDQTSSGRVGSHGMVLVGSAEQAFLSHIPMFHVPHDVQLVVSAKLQAAPGGALPATFSDRLFTFVPERLSLDALRLGNLRSFRGAVFEGNFEQGGRQVAGDVRVEITSVVHQAILDARAPAKDMTYLLFGSRAQTFAVHELRAAPSFDEVLVVSLDGALPDDAALGHGVFAESEGASDELAGRLGLRTATLKWTSGSVQAKAVKPLSCLVGPDFVDACE